MPDMCCQTPLLGQAAAALAASHRMPERPPLTSQQLSAQFLPQLAALLSQRHHARQAEHVQWCRAGSGGASGSSSPAACQSGFKTPNSCQ
jgi:hypothetical protein